MEGPLFKGVLSYQKQNIDKFQAILSVSDSHDDMAAEKQVVWMETSVPSIIEKEFDYFSPCVDPKGVENQSGSFLHFLEADQSEFGNFFWGGGKDLFGKQKNAMSVTEVYAYLLPLKLLHSLLLNCSLC